MLAAALEHNPSSSLRPTRLVTSSSRNPGKYEGRIQRILADREGRRTWSDLEDLERQADTDPKARMALRRLSALDNAQNYTCPHSRETAPSPQELARSIDGADRHTQFQAWRTVLRSSSRERRQAALSSTGSSVAWRVLGLPKSFGRRIGPAPQISPEQPRKWNRFMREAMRRRLAPGSDDPRLTEYRRLYSAHKRLESGRYRGKVSQRALYLDLKSLEEQLIPEEIGRARSAVKSQLLQGGEAEPLHPQSRVRRFLGSLSALPPTSRERRIVGELSQVALSRPRDLMTYASLVLHEIRSCPSGLSQSLLPIFRKALGQVVRTECQRHRVSAKLGSTESFRNLISSLTGDSLEAGDDSGELYRSGLTVNGVTRNYT